MHAGKANGVQTITLDGKEVNSNAEVDWSVDFDSNAFIEKFTFRVFHGGSSGWESPKDQYILCAPSPLTTHPHLFIVPPRLPRRPSKPSWPYT